MPITGHTMPESPGHGMPHTLCHARTCLLPWPKTPCQHRARYHIRSAITRDATVLCTLIRTSLAVCHHDYPHGSTLSSEHRPAPSRRSARSSRQSRRTSARWAARARRSPRTSGACSLHPR
eukprot:1419524-Rhodomonas_salina.1